MAYYIKLLAAGFSGGVLSGLLGVGGGIILIPLMVSCFAVKQHRAHATSLAVVIPTAACSGFIYGFHGNIDLTIAAYIIAGSMLGASISARIATKIPAQQLKRLFGLMLVVVGLRMIL